MKKYLIIAAVIIVGLVAAWFAWPLVNEPVKVGFGASSIPTDATEYNQIASRSTQGLIKSGAGRLFSLDVYNYSSNARFIQLFDMNAPVVPSRAASLSAPHIYAASNSWASAGQIVAKPITSWYYWASPSLIFSVPIPPAASSASPGILRLGSDNFSPALGFSRQLIYGISSTFATFTSASVDLNKIIVHATYE